MPTKQAPYTHTHTHMKTHNHFRKEQQNPYNETYLKFRKKLPHQKNFPPDVRFILGGGGSGI